jgi:hypothetical protein
MDVDQRTDSLTGGATRRTVIKTGAKLAYAAPLVAASFKLSARGAAAISPIGGGETCSNPFDPVACAFAPGDCRGCLVEDQCCPAICTVSPEGDNFCIGGQPDPAFDGCTDSDVCPTGFRCGKSCLGGGTVNRCFPVAVCGTSAVQVVIVDGSVPQL